MGYKVVEVQATPNPNALKYLLDRQISEKTVSFFRAEQAVGHALGERLFQIAGVSSVLILKDFVTVSKQADAHWRNITPKVKKILQSLE